MIEPEIKITVLCENTVGAPCGLTGEWGLAMLVEAAGKRILFDTGERGSLLPNAKALGIDLKSVDALVLSHGHYDHTGGIRALLQIRGGLPVYAHGDLFARHYSSPDEPRYVGVPFSREELEGLGAEFIFIREPRKISPGVWISGQIPRATGFEKVESRLFLMEGGKKTIPDPLHDDMSLYCATPEGLVIILGCAHAGLVNIVNHARQVTGVNRVYGIIGGTHLGPAPADQQEGTIEFLRGLDLKCLAANHCTGLPVISRLASVFGGRFHFAPAGVTFTLPVNR